MLARQPCGSRHLPGSMTSIDPYGVGADSISARKACHCRRRPRATNGHPYNALFRQSDLPLRGRCPEGAEGENLAMTRNIPARRAVLSPTACGRSPLAEGAKRDARFFYYLRQRIYFPFRLVKNCHIWYTVFLQVHRQTRCKPATQSYRGPSGQPVANKRLLFLLPSAASRPFWGRS